MPRRRKHLTRCSRWLPTGLRRASTWDWRTSTCRASKTPTRVSEIARDAFQQVLAADPGNLHALFCLGMYYQHIGENDKALEYFGKVQRSGPSRSVCRLQVRRDADFSWPQRRRHRDVGEGCRSGPRLHVGRLSSGFAVSDFQKDATKLWRCLNAFKN